MVACRIAIPIAGLLPFPGRQSVRMPPSTHPKTTGQPQSMDDPYGSSNIKRQLVAMLLTKTGDQFVNTKTVLPWVMGAVGAPVYLIGLLVPVRESLSMLPQFALAGYIRSLPYRKPAWIFGALIQSFSIIAMGLSACFFEGAASGWLILTTLAVFSLGRAVCSITGKDILGKTVSKSQRGRVNGWATTGSGVITILLALCGIGFLMREEAKGWLLVPFALAILLWWGAIVSYQGIREKAGKTERAKSAMAQTSHTWDLLSKDVPFRNFLITRSLMTGSALAAPYLVLISQQSTGLVMSQLGSFMMAGAVGAAISGWVWGRMADQSSRRVLSCASGLAALVCFSILATRGISQGNHLVRWIYPLLFMVLHVAHAGVRVGRKTYLLNLAEGNKRTDYVAISNTLVGCFLILAGLLISLGGKYPASWFVLLFGLMSLCGSLWTFFLPKTN